VGATLATKQPAMTASTLAAALDEAAGSRSPALSPGTDSVSPAAMEGLADVIVRTVRSQMAALFGNYLIAFPTALLVFLPFTLIGFPLMSAQKATATLASLDGLRSLSFWYAALAGVCLFVSGLMAGAADNWFVFNKVGERLKHSEMLRRLVKPHKLDRAIHTIDHNLGFWVGNTCLGFCLGSMLSIGEILGLPLDIRHITFASAQFGAALATLKFQAPLAAIALIAVSIFLMGLVNLAVSFSLTLFVVVRSRRIRFSQTPLLLSQLALRLRRNPLQFLLPIGEPP
jgi:site-specific recombinase